MGECDPNMRSESVRQVKQRMKGDASAASKSSLSKPRNGVVAGLPRFLRQALPVSRPGDRAEREADAWTGSTSNARIATGQHAFSSGTTAAAHRVVREAGAGETLPAREKRRVEARYGLDADEVRIHTDAGAEPEGVTPG